MLGGTRIRQLRNIENLKRIHFWATNKNKTSIYLLQLLPKRSLRLLFMQTVRDFCLPSGFPNKLKQINFPPSSLVIINLRLRTDNPQNAQPQVLYICITHVLSLYQISTKYIQRLFNFQERHFNKVAHSCRVTLTCNTARPLRHRHYLCYFSSFRVTFGIIWNRTGSIWVSFIGMLLVPSYLKIGN